jgi:hypothetical protein
MSAPSGRRMIRQRAVLAVVLGAVAFGEILDLTLATEAQSSQDSSRLVTIEPAATVMMPARRTGRLPSEPVQGGNPLWSLPVTSLSPPSPPAIAAPFVPPVSPPQQPKPEPNHPSLTLLGTLAGESQGIGIFINEADKTTLSLRTGEDHEGWILRTIRGGEATFEKGERTATLALVPPGSAAQAPASPFANTWRDGDGQMIGAPQRREQKPASPVAAPLRNTWLDGDGQMISAPPKSPFAPPAVAPTSVDPVL